MWTRITPNGGTSSNANKVIRAVLNFFFYKKISHAQQAQKAYKRAKIKTCKGKKSLVRLFTFLCFLYFLCLFCVQILFVKKLKRFEIALMASFTLLLNSSYYSIGSFRNLFQFSQFFLIIKIFFNYHSLFQILKSFLSQSSLS